MSASQDEIPPPPPPPPSSSQTPTQQTPHTVSTIKLPILKKGEYDIWAMKMERKWNTICPTTDIQSQGYTNKNVMYQSHTDTLGQIRFGGNDESKKIRSSSEATFKGFALSKHRRSLPILRGHEVSLIDWRRPTRESGHLSFDDLDNNLKKSLRVCDVKAH
ncbi:hypothetical protein Tco_0329043 [Tanacetum coccineum]